MNSIVYNTALVTHVAGITIMAGTTFIDFMLLQQFWKIYSDDKLKGMLLEENLYRLQRFMSIGLLIIVISGVVMMAYLHQVWGQQVWFRIKMGLLLLIVINGLVMRRRQGLQLKKYLTGGSSENKSLLRLKSNLFIIQSFQLLLFVAIFTLSIFKFN